MMMMMLRSSAARCARVLQRHISTDLFIKGLHPTTTAEAVFEAVKPFGDVTVQLMRHEENSTHRTAVVSFKTLDQAIAAYDEISDTTVIDKRRVRIDFSNVDKPVVHPGRTRPRKNAPAKPKQEATTTTAESTPADSGTAAEEATS